MLDTNVAVSAAISPGGPPAAILRAWLDGAFAWITSPVLLAELERTLATPRLGRYLSWTNDQIAEFIERLRQAAIVVEPSEEVDALDIDPDDNRVLEAAAAGKADYIVSGDAALLALREFSGSQIVTPARFLAILQTA